ncbi:hypothetical protein [Lysobacter sp. M15]|uniref:hypothetical protein n=1 Tax=Lysobacter sp. M15 TaxID=2916837 RepID=UPI001F55AF07|nr:hypothetical protein [Lysobacter sp. M15]
MNRVYVAAVLTLCLSTACIGAARAQALQLQRPVPYAEDNDISDNIKTECKINEQLADFVKQYAGEDVEFSDGPVDTAKGRALQLEILDAVSMGNAWMGHQKYAKVKGTLYEDGKKVASFKGRRNSMGGAFAGYKGSCSVLGRTVEALGEDIGAWLKAPQDGANLGD